MNTFEIVALNPENQGFNILEAGYGSYEDALSNREHWAMRFPHLWIEVITRNERIAMVSAEGLRKLNLV